MGCRVEEKELEEILAIQKREENLMKLIQETGCEIVQENGQRKFGGPPPSKTFVFYYCLELLFIVQFSGFKIEKHVCVL